MLKHSIFGVLSLAVAALDFTIGAKHMITAGIIALTSSAYSFTEAANLRKTLNDKENRP